MGSRHGFLLAGVAGLLAVAAPATAATGTTTRVSVSSAEVPGDASSAVGSISSDGRYVSFISYAQNLVPGDTNGSLDVFVRDRQAGTTRRVNVSSGGLQANGDSSFAAISANGRYVVFDSEAGNLVTGDTNDSDDVFRRDRLTGTTQRVSVSTDEVQATNYSYDPTVSSNGRYVAFSSSANNLVLGDFNGGEDVFVRDLQDGTTRLVSSTAAGRSGNGDSYSDSISADGRYVAFESQAADLVAGDTNASRDVFVRDLQTGRTVRASVSTSGVAGTGPSSDPSISTSGRYVAFTSTARLVPADTNSWPDIYVRDLVAGSTRLASVSTAGVPGGAASTAPAISGDGRSVAFESRARNLVAQPTRANSVEVYRHDLVTGTTGRISVTPAGQQGNRRSYQPAVSADGRHVSFASDATDLAPGDDYGEHVYVRDLG